MSDEAAGLLAALGALILKLVTSGRFVDYVRPRMGVLLLAAAAVLLIGGSVGLISVATGGVRPRIGRTGLALAIPVVLLSVVPPMPLGAFAAALRADAGRPPRPPSLFPALPLQTGGAVELSLSDFVSRALYDANASLRGMTVRLVGFAAPDPRGPDGSYDLVRFVISCCAADALALRVRILDPLGVGGRAPPADTWMEVTGTWRWQPPVAPGAFARATIPALELSSVRPIAEPANPYDGSA